MDIWHTAQPEEEITGDGWLGRASTAAPHASPANVPALGSARKPAAALSSRRARTPVHRSLEDYNSASATAPRRSPTAAIARRNWPRWRRSMTSRRRRSASFARRSAPPSTAPSGSKKSPPATSPPRRYPQTHLAGNAEDHRPDDRRRTRHRDLLRLARRIRHALPPGRRPRSLARRTLRSGCRVPQGSRAHKLDGPRPADDLSPSSAAASRKTAASAPTTARAHRCSSSPAPPKPASSASTPALPISTTATSNTHRLPLRLRHAARPLAAHPFRTGAGRKIRAGGFSDGVRRQGSGPRP